MNEHRIWKMCRLALFEQEEGKRDLFIASYYQRDYVGLGLLSNLIQVTVAYLILLAAVTLMNLDQLIEHFDELDYAALITTLIIAYLFMLGLYSVLVFTIRRLKYVRARRKVRDHYISLNELYEESTEEPDLLEEQA